MKIGRLSHLTGVSVRSIRYYEARGLVRPTRDRSGQRLFAPEDVDRVIRIQEMLAAGLGTRIIAEILPCLDVPVSQRTGFLEERLREEQQRIEDERRELDRAQRVLDGLRAELSVVRPDATRRDPACT
ncbi:MerR family transcriptional regulator [Nocardioides sp. zg-1228]|uniref:MerR family transcriptional regulator n=1 Tax=Nocardioides sp. zg-1228 TaxID=2763008 RepID=UPI001642596A|nr:MerR family transcriptional regulator [Nocardioides sp. zg-1228]MBC2934446.1 MerR family transcriptional regulator [Nocardioides sp. zg-1228]QSF59210.1 MerR family transcriptional regulator [Nocardioides sp. zg-1228]